MYLQCCECGKDVEVTIERLKRLIYSGEELFCSEECKEQALKDDEEVAEIIMLLNQ